MAGSFIPDGMNRSWGMASYVKAGAFLNHGFHGNGSLYVNEKLEGNEGFHSNQRHPIMALESVMFV